MHGTGCVDGNRVRSNSSSRKQDSPCTQKELREERDRGGLSEVAESRNPCFSSLRKFGKLFTLRKAKKCS